MLRNTINYHGSWQKLLVLPLLLFLVITILIIIAVAQVSEVDFWGQLNWPLGIAGQGGEFGEYCERNRMLEFIRQPSNSWSNIAYMMLGFICISFGMYDYKNRPLKEGNFIVNFPIFSILFGISLTYLCFGSFFYHASLTMFSQRMDMSGVYAVVLLPIVMNVCRTIFHKKKSTSNTEALSQKITLWGVIAILTLNVLFFIFKWSIDGKVALPVLILIVIGTLGYYHKVSKAGYSIWLGLLSIGSLVTAFSMWILDRNFKDVMCDPDSILQGHALWHLLTGASAFLLYLFFRSEKPWHPGIDGVK